MGVRIPENFLTHKSAWRQALRLQSVRQDLSPDDRAYWEHELKAYDDAHRELSAMLHAEGRA